MDRMIRLMRAVEDARAEAVQRMCIAGLVNDEAYQLAVIDLVERRRRQYRIAVRLEARMRQRDTVQVC
jgi:hypothetical protein